MSILLSVRKKCLLSAKQYIALCSVILILGIFIFNKLSLQYTDINKELIQNILESTGPVDVPVINWNPSRIQIQSRPSHICDTFNKDEDSIIIAIKSYIGDFDQRLAIRKTWGNITNNKIKRVFFVGFAAYAIKLLKVEDNLYSDIVTGSFQDEYDNNIFKTLMIFKWISQYCMGAKYVLLVDDDYFVNVKKLVSFIDYVKLLPANPLWMIGNKCHLCTPRRTPGSKWYVSYSEYKFYFWPPYFHGGSIFTTPEVITKMITIAPYVKHFHIDDIYIGMLAYVLGIDLRHDEKFAHDPVSHTMLSNVFTSHGYSGRFKLVDAWNAFIKLSHR